MLEATLDKTMSAAVEPKAMDLMPLQTIALPPNWSLQDLEKWLDNPRRIRASIKVKNLGDFLKYVSKFKRGESSIVFVNPSLAELGSGATLATAVIDYHEAPAALQPGAVYDEDIANWCTHTVEFQPTASPAYAMLCALDGKLLPQDEFAQKLRELARFCTSHAAADLLETVRTLSLTSRGEYASLNDDVSGSVRLAYDVQVDARAGTSQRSLEIPRVIVFTVPVFLGDAPEAAQAINAELLYRVPKRAGGSVSLGIRMPDRLWLEHDLVTSTAKEIGSASGLLTITGTR